MDLLYLDDFLTILFDLILIIGQWGWIIDVLRLDLYFGSIGWFAYFALGDYEVETPLLLHSPTMLCTFAVVLVLDEPFRSR